MSKGRKASSSATSAEHNKRSRTSRTRELRPAAEPDPRALLHELRVHQLELEMQNDELRTARVETEAALARYTELFDFAPVGYVTITGDGQIVNINHSGARLVGRTRSQLHGCSFVELLQVQHRFAFRNLIAAAEGCGTARSTELELERGNGSSFPVRLSVVALPRVASNLLVTFEDISELRQSQWELGQKQRELDEAERRRDELLGVLSQELRNPLAPIRNSLFVLEHAPPGSEAARRAQHVIDRQVSHLTRLIDDALDVTRLARGKIQLQLERVELSGLLRAVLDDHRSSFEAAGVLLEARCDAALWVQADSARLVQVIGNLLANALRFTPRGGAVQVSLTAREGRALLSVSDTGAGLPQEVLEPVLEPLARAPQPWGRAQGGLGLAMVHGLAQLHGGHVSFRRKGLGSGTLVELWLPRCPAPVAVRPEPPPVVRTRRRVLLIDDHGEGAESLQAALSMNGHEVRSAPNGPRGLELAASFAPEVVICNVALPGMDGYAVARAFRAHASLSQVQLIAVSGHAQPDDLRREKEAGFDGHLPKPASISALERLLSEGRRS